METSFCVAFSLSAVDGYLSFYCVSATNNVALSVNVHSGVLISPRYIPGTGIVGHKANLCLIFEEWPDCSAKQAQHLCERVAVSPSPYEHS